MLDFVSSGPLSIEFTTHNRLLLDLLIPTNYGITLRTACAVNCMALCSATHVYPIGIAKSMPENGKT